VEERGIFCVIEEFRIRESGISRRAARCRIEREHAVLVRDEWIWANQNSFDPTQHRGVGSDAEREAKYCQNRKARRPQKHSHAEANVLNKFIGPSPNTLLA